MIQSRSALSPRHLVTLSSIIVAYLTIGALYAVNTPAWQVPDEPAHYNYVRQVAETGALPQLEVGDYDQDYMEQLMAQRFPPDLPLDPVQYQDYQPPLYYLLATPIFTLFTGSLVALRLFSLTLGAGVILFAYLAVRQVTSPDSLLPWLAAGFIAFIPQHVAMLAGVNNDSLAELVIATGLWLVLRQNRLGIRPWLPGLVLGAAFLTKVQAYALAPVIAAMLLLHWRRSGWSEWRPILRNALIIFGVGLALGALYWGRNWVVCGPADFVCGNWHSRVVLGQPTTREWIAVHGWWGNEASLLNRFFIFTFDSFWGVFGWLGVFMDQRVYAALLVFSVGLAIGALAAARRWPTLSVFQREGLMLLTVSALTSVALYLYYNLEFVQHQGRYLFPALIPIGLAAAAGIRQWAKWGLKLLHLPSSGSVGELWLSLLPLALMTALDVFALYRFVIPQLA